MELAFLETKELMGERPCSITGQRAGGVYLLGGLRSVPATPNFPKQHTDCDV